MFKSKIKKMLLCLSAFMLIIGSYSFVFADEADEDLDFVWLKEEISKPKEDSKEVNILSRTAIAYDRTSKTVLFGKNENTKVKMASTTKIMTAIVMLENVKNLDETVEVCKQAANIGGSRLGLKTGDKITYKDLLYGLLLCSGNDCAIQISVSVAGTVENFAKLMNEKAKQLRLKNTNFVTPHGLDEDEHYTTAYELAKMTDYALNNDMFQKVVSTKLYTARINNNEKQIGNTNELLGYLNGVNGVKTGFTNGAGRCLVTSVDRNGFNIITVVLGADTKKIRTRDSIKLIEHIYDKYELIDLKSIIEEEFEKWFLINNKRIHVNKGVSNELELELKDNLYTYYPVKKGENPNIKATVNFIRYIEAPVLKDELIGTLNVEVEGKRIGSIDIVNKESIAKKGVKDYFKMCIESLKIQKVSYD